MSDFIEHVNFHFRVDFPGGGRDLRFQSVSGLDSTLDTESIREGGVNGYEHVVPVRRKYGPLILKRGILKPSDSKVTKWLKKAFNQESVEPYPSIDIILLDEEHNPLMKWTISNVWPRSWKVGELDAMKGEILLETLELNYNTLIFNNV
jgi:phage tail-like protein